MKKALKVLRLSLALLLVIGMILPLVACKPSDDPKTQPTHELGTFKDDGKTYSYRMGPSDLPENWNLHTYTSNSSTYVLDYSSDNLYTFEYNKDFTGFEIVPAMAKEFPVDVTSEYVGKYGIVEGDENKAYKITLKDNLKFDNGEKLDANSFVASMKLLLDPAAANFRADNVYATGNMKIYNADAYVKQGTTTYEDLTGGEGLLAEYQGTTWSVTNAEDGTQITKEVADNIFFSMSSSYVAKWAIDNYADAGYSVADVFMAYVDVSEETLNAMDGKSLTEILANEDMFNTLQTLLYDFWCTDDGEPYGFFCTKNEWGELSFDKVGFFAPDANTLVVVLKNPMEDNFYLRYELCTSFFLVYAPMYESLIKMTDGVYSNSYATSVDTYVGYGPYKLTQYVEGASIVMERNLNWRGYQDGEYLEGTYQTDRIVYTKVKEDATRLEMFLKGELDSYGLTAEDMADYLTSDYTVFTDSDSTWYIAMNPGYESLTAAAEATDPVNTGYVVNKTVLLVDEFRKALSYSLDRTAFNQQLSPTSGVAKGLLSSMIVADPESGLSYRAMDIAKDAILDFWGLADKWGEGKEYATRDDAIDSITGYDPAGAKTLFDAAYDQAVEIGYITADMISAGNWEVQICIGKPSEANYYNKGYEFLKACWTDAVKDTKFEGHVTFVQSQTLGSSSFGEYLRTGKVDLLFGVGFSGSMFDPFSLFDVYTGSLQYDPFTDKNAIDLDVVLGGQTLRASLYNWVSVCLQGDEITVQIIGEDGNPTGETKTVSYGVSADAQDRVKILAAAETKILNLNNVIPLQTDASASLRCMRITYKTQEYVLGMGFGGVEWYTYGMDDTEFLNYAKSCTNGILPYKA